MGCPSDVKIGDNLVFSVCTHDPDTGVLTDADAVPPYRVYEDETSTAILTGNMAKLDDANTTGCYSEILACTSGNGFEDGKTYTVYIEATVDSDKGGKTFGFKAHDHDITDVQDDLDNATDGLSALKAILDTSGVVVASIANNAITAASINADAITAAKIADDAIAAEHLATNAITADALADNTIDAGSIAANAITSSEIADGALTSVKFGADFLTSAKIADNAIAVEHIATGALADAYQYVVHGVVAYDDTGDNLLINSWLELKGEMQSGITSGTAKVYNKAGTQQGSTITDNTPDAQGVLQFTQATTPIAHDETYYIQIAIVSGGTTYTGEVGFATAD